MTPLQRWEQMIRKARLLDYLLLLACCITFYGTCRILGIIPPPPEGDEIVAHMPNGFHITEVHGFAVFSGGPAVCVTATNGTDTMFAWLPQSFFTVEVAS